MVADRRKRRTSFPPLTGPQRDLAGRNYGLACHLAWRRSRPCPGRFEHYLDAATDGLIGAARDFDEGRGLAFSPIARRYMRRAMNNMDRTLGYKCRRPAGRKFSLHSVVRQGDIPSLSLDPKLFDDSPTFDELLKPLPDRVGESLRLRFSDGLSLSQCASRMGIGHHSVHRDQKIGLSMLRDGPARPANPPPPEERR